MTEQVAKTTKQGLKPAVIVATTAILVICLVLLATNGDGFSTAIGNANNWLLDRFGWLYLVGTFAIMVMCILVYVSPLGKVRVGGRNAVSKMSKPVFYAIALCTMIAVGMLMWGGAEIMAHYSEPPAFWGVAPLSPEAAEMGMAQVFIDWTFMPFAVYAMPTVLFAFAFYNMKKSFSLSSLFAPLLGDKLEGRAGQILDVICSITLIAGIVCSLGQGAMTILAGLGFLSGAPGLDTNVTLIVILIFIIGVAFTISAVTGVLKGIRLLSIINAVALLAIAVFALIAGPTVFIFKYATEAGGTMLGNFFTMVLNTESMTGDRWAYNWPIFYFAVYLAWALISSVFLGRISKGFSFKTVLNGVFVIPSLVSGGWLAIMSGVSMNLEVTGTDMVSVYQSGVPNVSFAILDSLPATPVLVVIFILLLFVGFTTAGDSLTNAIAGLCTKKAGGDDTEPPRALTTYWGVVTFCVTALCAAFLNFDQLRAVANIGAFPALIVEVVAIFALWRAMWHPARFDVHKDDYDEYGRPIPSDLPEGAPGKAAFKMTRREDRPGSHQTPD